MDIIDWLADPNHAIITITSIAIFGIIAMAVISSDRSKDAKRTTLNKKEKALVEEIADSLIRILYKIPGVTRKLIKSQVIEYDDNLLLFFFTISNQKTVNELSKKNEMMIALVDLFSREHETITSFAEAKEKNELPVYNAGTITAMLKNDLDVIADSPRFSLLVAKFRLQAEFNLNYSNKTNPTKKGGTNNA